MSPPRSLRLRLLGLAALWVSLALVVAGFVILYLFTANVERSLRADLEASLNRLVALIDPEAPAPALDGALPDPRYLVPFSGLYWQVDDLSGGGSARSRSLWDFVLTPPPAGASGGESFASVAGPERQVLAALSRDVQFDTGEGRRAYRVTLAEDRVAIDESIAQFGSDMAVALLILGLAILLAAWLQVLLGLRPLGDIRKGLESVRRGTSERLGGNYPTELLPLVGEVNELMAVREKSIEFARARASDLAHGLKTSLSVLAATAARLRDKGDIESAETLDELAGEMEDRIDYQLRLARLRLRSASHVLSASLNAALTRTIAVLQKTQAGEKLTWAVELGPDLAVNMDRHDLIELVGVLLENAAEWAKSEVRVSVQKGSGLAEVAIEDDGPGLRDEDIGSLGVRGRRLDESRKGSGFGLAIAFEILALNNGTVHLGRSAQGGLKVTLCIPTAAA